jgi:7-carboxy-7-deazaguanine synthase
LSYSVKRIWHTLQGEGLYVGTPAVFCRLVGCGLWSGREEDRGKGGSCSAWCDTDFRGPGDRMTAAEIAARADALWPGEVRRRRAVLTGGEPTLQADAPLVSALQSRGFRVAIETNGTKQIHWGDFDWVTCSPKAGAPLVLDWADELKLVYPQAGAEPESFSGFHAGHRFLQPMDGPEREANTRAAVAYCLDHPAWRLSLQTHKLIGID